MFPSCVSNFRFFLLEIIVFLIEHHFVSNSYKEHTLFKIKNVSAHQNYSDICTRFLLRINYLEIYNIPSISYGN